MSKAKDTTNIVAVPSVPENSHETVIEVTDMILFGAVSVTIIVILSLICRILKLTSSKECPGCKRVLKCERDINQLRAKITSKAAVLEIIKNMTKNKEK